MATVLIVDDNRGVRDALQIVLEDEGFQVVTAANGRRALERIARQRPDLILLDLHMPVMSGWEVQERLEALALGIPVVFMSGCWNARAEAEAHGADGYLCKPFEIADLLAVVSRFTSPALPC